MADEGTPIPFVKLSGEVERAPAPDNYWREDVFVFGNIVNIGTAPTTAADQVWGSLILGHTVIAQQHQNLDSPPLEANGGSRNVAFKFDGHYMAVADDWQLSISITNADGSISDDGRTPVFSVKGREGQDAPSF